MNNLFRFCSLPIGFKFSVGDWVGFLQEGQAKKSFSDWVQEKNRQAQRDKLMLEYKKQEEQSVLYTRTQEDSDAAFKK